MVRAGIQVYSKTCTLVGCTGTRGGNQFRIKAPTLETSTEQPLTMPNTREMQDKIMAAKSSGQLFHATGGRHIYSDAFFIGKEREVREARMKAMVADKKFQLENVALETVALKVLADQHGESIRIKDLKVLIKWKQGGKPAKSSLNRDALRALWGE